MKHRKTIWLSCGIPVLLLIGIFSWLYFWSAGWEKCWGEFRQQAEAEGEDFAWQTDRGEVGPDAENFFAHPWIKKTLSDGSDKTVFSEEVIHLLYDPAIDTVSNDPIRLSKNERLWLDRAAKLLESHHEDLNAFTDASKRPFSSCEVISWVEMVNDDTWTKLSDWGNLLIIRANYRQATNDHDGFEDDVKTLRSLAQHLHAEHTAKQFLMGVGVYVSINKLAEKDLEQDFYEHQKAFWKNCLSDPPEPYERVIMHVMRTERNGFLALIEKDLSMEKMLSLGMEKPWWQNNVFRRKAAHAANKLTLCKDFQETIASPDLRGEQIVWKHLEDFEKRMKVREKEDTFYGRTGLLPWVMLGSLHNSCKELEIERHRLLKKLAQSP